MKRLSFIAASVFLFVTSVLCDCTQFKTTQSWSTGFYSSAVEGYEFLGQGIYQISDLFNENGTSGLPRPPRANCRDENTCGIFYGGELSIYATYNVTPTDPGNVAKFQNFFNVVLAAAEENKNESTPEPPVFHACKTIEFGESPGFCSACNELAWVQFVPSWRCISGVTESCTDGPFENGTPLKVCSITQGIDGAIYPQANSTVRDFSNTTQYTASVNNPNLEGTCPSAGTLNFKLDRYMLWLVVLGVPLSLAM